MKGLVRIQREVPMFILKMQSYDGIDTVIRLKEKKKYTFDGKLKRR